jgi:uncharacterized protein YuzB (UPF0349 family)
MVLYVCGDDAGIHFSSIEGLDEFNSEWRIWFEDMEEDELWEFQKHGVAFAEICARELFCLVGGESVLLEPRRG